MVQFSKVAKNTTLIGAETLHQNAENVRNVYLCGNKDDISLNQFLLDKGVYYIPASASELVLSSVLMKDHACVWSIICQGIMYVVRDG